MQTIPLLNMITKNTKWVNMGKKIEDANQMGFYVDRL